MLRQYKPQTGAGAPNQQTQIPFYARVSLAAFLCCMAVLILLIRNVDRLSSLGLTEHVYFLVLVLMGLTAALVLFGVLPSSATYEGMLLGGTLKLGGAVVGAALVVVGGFFFIPRALTFPLTVYVQGRQGPQDTAFQGVGYVKLRLGPDTRKEKIGDNWQAYFPAIPSNFKGQTVPVWVEAETYESMATNAGQKLDGNSILVTIKQKIIHYQLGGIITDEEGKLLSGVRVTLPQYGIEDITGENGRFNLHVDGVGQPSVDLFAQKEGFEVKRMSATLGNPGQDFSMKRGR